MYELGKEKGMDTSAEYVEQVNKIAKELLAQIVMKKTLDEVTVLDEEVLKYYNENQEAFKEPANVTAKHILIDSEELAKEIPNSFIAGQFVNQENPKAHFATTGPEIYEDTDGNVDIFVAGVGTGGSITGTGKYLNSQNSDIKVVAVEPASSPVLSEGVSGPHKIQGIGAGFVPDILDTTIYDEIIKVENEDAFKFGRLLGNKEGVLVGISSGAALYAAVEVAKREENKGKNIVVILPDSGDRYLSTELFGE